MSDVRDAFACQLAKNFIRHCPTSLRTTDIPLEDILNAIPEPCPLRDLSLIGDINYLEDCIDYVIDSHANLPRLQSIYYRCSPATPSISSIAYACCVAGVSPLHSMEDSSRVIDVFLSIPVADSSVVKFAIHRIGVELIFKDMRHPAITFFPALWGSYP